MQDFKQYKQGLIDIDKIKPYERNAKNVFLYEHEKNADLNLAKPFKEGLF